MRTPLGQSTVPGTLLELVNSINVQVSGNSENARFKSMYSNDRIAFVHDIMPEYARTITPYQEWILGQYDSGVTRIAIRGPHGLGKTFLASILVHHGVLTAESDAKIPTTASAWRQLEQYLWPEIRKAGSKIYWPNTGRTIYSRDEMLQQELRVDEARAFALSSDDHTSLEGAHATFLMFVFDEAKAIPVPTWDALEGAFSTEGLSTTHQAMAFAISTPGDPSGRFYDIHMRRPGYEDWTVRHVTVDEAMNAGRISPSWVEQRRKQWGQDSVMFQNRVLGEFADNSEDGVIPLTWVRAANERWLDWRAKGFTGEGGAKRVLGVDTARAGKDSTAVAERIGVGVRTVQTYSKSSLTSTAGRLKAQSNSGQYALHIEMDSLGASIYDMLREQNVPRLKPIHPSGKPFNKDRSGQLEFLNNRAAMWWNLREMLDPEQGDGIMLPDDPRLVGELIAPKFDYTSNGKLKLESKESIKKRIGRSTDMADSVCLSFFGGGSGGGVVF